MSNEIIRINENLITLENGSDALAETIEKARISTSIIDDDWRIPTMVELWALKDHPDVKLPYRHYWIYDPKSKSDPYTIYDLYMGYVAPKELDDWLKANKGFPAYVRAVKTDSISDNHSKLTLCKKLFQPVKEENKYNPILRAGDSPTAAIEFIKTLLKLTKDNELVWATNDHLGSNTCESFQANNVLYTELNVPGVDLTVSLEPFGSHWFKICLLTPISESIADKIRANFKRGDKAYTYKHRLYDALAVIGTFDKHFNGEAGPLVEELHDLASKYCLGMQVYWLDEVITHFKEEE